MNRSTMTFAFCVDCVSDSFALQWLEMGEPNPKPPIAKPRDPVWLVVLVGWVCFLPVGHAAHLNWIHASLCIKLLGVHALGTLVGNLNGIGTAFDRGEGWGSRSLLMHGFNVIVLLMTLSTGLWIVTVPVLGSICLAFSLAGLLLDGDTTKALIGFLAPMIVLIVGMSIKFE